MTAALIERALTPAEIEDRRARKDDLWKRWRRLEGEKRRVRDELRQLQRDSREALRDLDQVEGEITSGKALVPRQQDLPGTQPCEPYPLPPMDPAPEALAILLGVVLQRDPAGGPVPTAAELGTLPGAELEAIAHWARVELAYMNERGRDDVTYAMPSRLAMPDSLFQLRSKALTRNGRRRKGAGKA